MKNVLNLGLMFAVAGITYMLTRQAISQKFQSYPFTPADDTYPNPEY